MHMLRKHDDEYRGHRMHISKERAARRRLFHLDTPGCFQFITFRLADSLPVCARERWYSHPAGERQRAFGEVLDRGYGACVLRNPAAAHAVEAVLAWGNGTQYDLVAWCVMPNHVHVLIRQFDNHPLARVVRCWKSISSRCINQSMQQRGQLWAHGYFDRYIRDNAHLVAVESYIHNNPVAAGLVRAACDWPFSSARGTKALAG